MKDWTQTLTIAGLILALAALMYGQHVSMEARIDARFDRLESRIEAVDARVYELNERLTRVETLILNPAE